MFRSLGFAFLFSIALSPLASAGAIGLKVGAEAPDFTLTAGGGSEVSLSQRLAKGPAVLVFVRSADWCPYCRQQLQDLERHREAIEASGAQLIALSYDDATTQAKAVAKLGLTYPLLADPGSKTIEAYGILNHEARGKAAGIPHPAIFIVDTDGKISAKLMEEGYKARPSHEQILEALQGLR